MSDRTHRTRIEDPVDRLRLADTGENCDLQMMYGRRRACWCQTSQEVRR